MAANPSPLPLPDKVDLSPLELMMQAAANATGSARPEVTAAAAQSAQSPADAVTNAQAVNQFANANQLADQLKGESTGDQQQAWDSFSPQVQAQLHAAGYRKPGKPGFFGDVLHTLEGHPMSAFKAAGQGLSDTVGKVVGSRPVGDVLNALGSPLRAVQHGIRTELDLADIAQRAEGDTSMASVTKGNSLSGGLAEWGHFFSELVSPHDWSRAWQETTKGQSYILPEVQRQVTNKYGPDTYHLALRVATGTSQTTIIQQAMKQDPSGQIAKQMANTMQSKDFGQAVQLLNAGHLSVGRMAVGPDFIARHPGIGNTLSGGIDGTVDWFGDPTVIGGKAATGLRVGAHIVNSAEDVNNLYERSQSVRNAMSDIAGIVASKNNVSQQLLTRYRSLGSAAQELQQVGADTPDKVRQYFADRMAEKSVMEGLGGNSLHSSEFFGKPLPTLSRLGAARLAVKGTLEKAIDHSSDKPYTISGLQPTDTIPNALTPQGVSKVTVGGGRLARRALTLVSQERMFNPNDPKALENLRDIAKMFLPSTRVGTILDHFATEPDLGARWKIYRSTMIELGKAAGIDRNPDAWKAYLGKFTSTEGRFYAPQGNDLVQVNGENVHAGWLLAHQNAGWLVPSFGDMYKLGRQVGMSQLAGRAVNAEVINKVMANWRPLTLARPAFAARAGGEEAARFVLAEGVGPYLKGQAARLARIAGTRAKAAQAAIDNPDLSLADTEKAAGITDPIASSLDDVQSLTDAHQWNRFAGHLPTATQNKIRSLKDLIREYTVDQVRRAMDKTGEALTPDEYRQVVDDQIKYGAMEPGGHLYDKVGAMHGWDPKNVPGGVSWMGLEDVADPGRGKQVPMEITKTGKYKEYAHTDPLHMHMWWNNLAQLASDDWGREALLWRRPYADRISAVADRLESHPLAKDSILSHQNPGGQLVVNGEITQRMAHEAHAERIVKNTDQLIRSWDPAANKYKPIVLTKDENGKDVTLADFLLKNGKPPSMPALGNIPEERRPKWVVGPEMTVKLDKPNMVHKYADWMFTKIIGPQMNAISREPITTHNMAVAYKELEPWRRMLIRSGLQEDHVNEMRFEAAQQRAIDKTLPYVHNPALRSQLSVITRNLAPFWFAQEQFYKRWGRTLVESPAALRKAQLLGMGIRHAGFIHTDPENNQQYFVYPGSALAQSVIASTLSHFGLGASAPVSAGLIGQVNMLNPGLERLGGPSFGPMVVVPLNALKSLDPHMTAAIDAIEGKQASSSGFLKAMLPTTVMRALDFLDPKAFDPAQYASAQMSAMQAMEASGHGMGTPAVAQVASKTAPNLQPGDYVNQNGVVEVYQPDGTWRSNADDQEYLDKLAKFSRALFFTRLLFGMSVPASPEVQFNPGNMNTELKQLMVSMGPSAAIQTFLARHPYATAETIFQTQTKAGGFLPATKASMQFLDSNPTLMKDFGLAASYFIPQPATTGKFDLAAYQEQMKDGYRERKDPKTFYEQAIYQAAANVYYKMDDYRNKLIVQNPGQRRAVDAQWTQWSERFMQVNPIFARLYSDTGSIQRMQIMDQVGNAIRSGAAPQNAQTAAIGVLYNTWQTWKAMTGNFGNPNQPPRSSAQTRSINEQFADWLARYVAANPGVKPLVDRTIRPDLSQTLNTMAANGVPVTI